MSTLGLRVIGVVIWLSIMAALALIYITLPPSPDQSQFDWMAFIATQGQPFYVGSFDMNWPGEMWLHELGIRIFGVHAWTWRLTDFLLMGGFTLAGAMFLSRCGWQIAPLVFLFLYPPLYISAGGWMAGQRDIIATGFLLMACALAIPGGRREAISVLAAGLMVAGAVLIRPTFLSFIAGLIILQLLPLKVQNLSGMSRAGRSVGLLLGFIAGLGAATLFGLYLGNLDDWYQQSIEFSLSVYVGEPAQDWRVTLQTLFVHSWHWITGLAFVGVGFWVRRDGLGYALLLLLGVAATSAMSFVVQNKGFGYHLGGILTVLVLYAAVAFDGFVNWWRSSKSRVRSSTALGVLIVATFVATAGASSKIMNYHKEIRLLLNGDFGPSADYGLTEAERQEIINILQTGSKPDAKVLVYGTNFELAYRAELLPSHKFINVVIDQASPNFPHYGKWMHEIDEALAKNPPEFVIFSRTYLTGPIEKPTAAAPGRRVLERLVTLLADNYRPVFGNKDVIVYAQKKSPE